jgi:hypothetical protein
MVEKLSEFAKCELDKGIEQVDTKEMGEVAEIIKELSEAEYYAKISKAMDEAEYGEDYDYMGAYDEHERKGYRGQRRDSRGRYMSRRGYESRMMPEMDWDDMEYQRDMDRNTHNKMYYTDGSMTGSSSMGGSQSSGSMGSQGGSRGYSESRYDRARRGYEETKAMHNSGSAEDKQLTMKEAEKMVNVIFDELEESLSDAPKEVKDMIKNKGMAKLQKI